jgi:hypothetical protein
MSQNVGDTYYCEKHVPSRKEDALFEISPATAPGLKFGLPSEA